MKILETCLLFTFSLFLFCACGNNTSNKIEINQAWVRLVPSVSTTSAAFLQIRNNSKLPIFLISAESDSAKRVEIHTMKRTKDGVMHMMPIKYIEVQPYTSQSLAPGGNHIMLIDLVKPLTKESIIPITLKFKNQADILLNVPVKEFSAHSQMKNMNKPITHEH